MNNSELIFELLGISKNVPLTEREMAEALTVTFYPPHKKTPLLNSFSEKLKNSLIEIGVKIVPYDQALTKGKKQKIKPGIVIIEQGEGEDENLAIKKVSSLYYNPIVALLESAPPIPQNPTLQETLDSIVGVLAWNLSHVPVFVEEDKWTFCTMNGAVIECDNWRDPNHDILYSLIPKLSAQVVPPKREEIVYREGQLDSKMGEYSGYIDDFMGAAKVWRDNGLMLAHTSIEDLKYRNRFYKRIVSQYLDNRTGMSYGFLVKQLPADIEPAVELKDAPQSLRDYDWNKHRIVEKDEKIYVLVHQFGKEWIVKIPDVWLLSTRSGCNKTNLNPRKDILRLGLHKGEITIDTPPEIGAEGCRPSYDTYAILAHAVGNIITASLLLRNNRKSTFSETLQNDGVSISHWHGYPDKQYPLPGYVIHGGDNPPVSCSTPQSAAYAFYGKLRSLDLYKGPAETYRGDIHIEPHHGTNITGCMTITESAKWVDKMHKNKLAKEQVPG